MRRYTLRGTCPLPVPLILPSAKLNNSERLFLSCMTHAREGLPVREPEVRSAHAVSHRALIFFFIYLAVAM